jgi:hypothetical protein
MTDHFRLVQEGKPIVWVSGDNLVDEITHYADIYEQYEPVIIQKKVNGRWKDWEE